MNSQPEKEISHEDLFGAGHPLVKEAGRKEQEEGKGIDEFERRPMIPLETSFPSPSERGPSKSAQVLGHIFRWALYLTVFLTPLFFFSSSDPLGFSKNVLLSVLALVVLASWAGKVISQGQIDYRSQASSGWLIWPALAVGVVVFLSSFFSSSFWVSFLGDDGRHDFSVVAVLSYVVIFLAILENIRGREAARLIWATLAGAGLIILTSLLQFAGAFIFPGDFIKDRFFSPVGSIFTLALFAGFLLPIILALAPAAKRKWLKVGLVVLGLLDFLILLLVDFRTAWIALAVSTLVFTVTANWRSGAGFIWQSQRRLAVPLLILILALVFWLFPNIPGFNLPNAPVEISPSYGASLGVVKGSWADNFILGSGPETFPYEYGKTKSADLNQTNFWGVNFNNANAEVITWASNHGLLGALAFAAFVIWFLLIAFRRLRGRADLTDLGLLAGWIFILASKFFYSTPLPLELFFWVLPALFVVRLDEDDSTSLRAYEFRTGSFKTLALFIVSLLVLVASLAGLFFSARRFLAERNYTFAIGLGGDQRAEQITRFQKALSLNSRVPRYLQAFGRALIVEANDMVGAIAARSPAQPTDAEAAQIQRLTSQAFAALTEARRLDQENVSLLIDLAESYRLTAGYVLGANDLAIEIYERTAALEPINPFLKTQLAQLYLIKGNFFLDQTVRGGDLIGQAKNELEQALVLNSVYSNARYFLGLILDRGGDRVGALAQFEQVLAFNPDNETIRLIVANLRAGRAALGPPPPSEPARPPVPAEEAQGR